VTAAAPVGCCGGGARRPLLPPRRSLTPRHGGTVVKGCLARLRSGNVKTWKKWLAIAQQCCNIDGQTLRFFVTVVAFQ